MRKELTEFGKKLEILQCQKGVSTTELAKKIGVFHQNITQLKKTHKPTPKTINKLAAALSVPVTYFLEHDMLNISIAPSNQVEILQLPKGLNKKMAKKMARMQAMKKGFTHFKYDRRTGETKLI